MTMINKHSSSKDFVAKLSTDIIKLFDLNFKSKNIYIGGTNKKHIKKRHKKEFDKYVDKLPEIIKEPTYIGVHPKQGGIEFIKKYKENVLVAVRASKNDVLYVRSIYFITQSKIDKYLEERTIKKIKP